MANKSSFYTIALIISTLYNCWGQSPAFSSITLPVFQNNTQLAYPFTGGLNAPQIMNADLNNDGAQDLVIFDRSGYVTLTFINNLTGGTGAYYYAPEFARTFPPLRDYVLLRDYDKDGIMDIFCAPLEEGSQEMRVFKGRFESNILHFDPVLFHYPNCSSCNPTYIYYPDEIPGLWNNFPISSSDYPAVDDVDNDGDLDIIAFSAGNSVYLSFLKNTSVEQGFGTDSLHFVQEDYCWGKFFENGIAQCKTLLSATPNACAVPLTGGIVDDRNERHPGATVLTFDADNDGDKDVLLGNISFDCLNFLSNGGTPQQAWMTAQDTMFPHNDTPVNLLSFPASFYLDINNDNVKDLLVSPNSPTLHEDRYNVWWYKNVGTNVADFKLQTKKLFTSGMIDMGTATHPAVVDVNGDGLKDMVVGNYGFFTPAQNNESARFTNARLYLYLNTGSTDTPQFTLADEDWLNMSQYAPNDYDFAPTFGDLDGDDDLDLLIGSNLGALYCFYNEAGPGNPMNLVQNFNTLWSTMDVGQVSTPFIYDLDNDGLIDILMGERNGNVNFYKNIGSPTEPNFNPDENTAPNIPNLGAINTQIIPNGIGFSSPQVISYNNQPALLTGTQDGHFELYQLTGATANSFPEINLKFGNVDVGRRSTPVYTDLNNDGIHELLTGNQRGGLSLFKTELSPFQNPVNVTAAPSALTLNIAPNPASEQFFVTVPNAINQPKHWQLTDALGRMVASGNASDAVLSISCGHLPSGIYLVTIRTATAAGSQKIIVK